MNRRIFAALGVLTIGIQMLVASSPAHAQNASLDSRKVTWLSLTPIPAGENGDAVLGVRVEKRRGQTLPPSIVVRYNDELLQLEQAETGRNYALYTVEGRIPQGQAPLKPVIAPVRNGQTPPEKIGCAFGIVRCPRGCKSVIFGSDCVVCIVFECSTSPTFPSVK